jgi:hypothetical protein
MIHHPAFTPAPRMPSARSFFEELCPQILAARRAHLEQLSAIYAFEIEGEGSWSIEVPEATVASGISKRAELVVKMGSADFDRLIAGRLEVASAHREGRIQIRGAIDRLRELSIILGA